MIALGLHNIHYPAQSDLAIREVGECGTRRRTSLVAQSHPAVNPFLRSSAPVNPALFPIPEALCVDVSSSLTAVAVPCWRRLQAHSYLPTFTRARIFLRCTSCGNETPGWVLNAPPPRLRFAGHPKRHTGWLTKPPRSATRG